MRDCSEVIVTLDYKRRLRIPSELASVQPGDQFFAAFDAKEETITFRRIKRKSNWLEVWKQCPVLMDDLPPRSRKLPKKRKR